MLKKSPTLHTLVLDLHRNGIGVRGTQALAALHESPSLRCLTLNMHKNMVGASGAMV